MPDTRRHRGRHPDDDRLFSDDRAPALRAAVTHLSWLLTRGYAPESALKLVGDHFSLTTRQRMAVRRSSCADDALHRRSAHRLPPAACRGERLGVDGYNLLITVESALSGGLVLVGRDGCCRDLASIHGTYRRVEETEPALTRIADAIQGLEVAGVDWYLDQPVSNSGRLKAFLADLLERRRADGHDDGLWNIELVGSPDRILATYAGVVVTTDGPLLDRVSAWTHLAGDIISQIHGTWRVDLGGGDAGTAITRPAEAQD